MPALSDFDIPALAARFAGWGYPPSAAAKVLRRYFDTGGQSIDGPQIARGLRARLDAEFPLRSTQIVARRNAADGTVKFLVGLPTGHAATRLLDTAPAQSVECVLMPSHRPDRAAGCVSSQVGCAMGCDFCASTKAGVERSLTAGEIVEQFLTLRAQALQLGRRLQTLVFMGMGEPLLNYDAVTTAIRRIAGQDLGAIGWRQVMVS
ncbi:MAG: 23S rRNA (adenine(2503)-C(2))-methyltransferase RlmN, partial [Phycisphaerae bacterium]